jgi:uncharacterized protein (TIGR03067 family)
MPRITPLVTLGLLISGLATPPSPPTARGQPANLLGPINRHLVLAPDDAPPDRAGREGERERERERHQGTWRVTSFVSDGAEAPPEVAGKMSRVVEGDHVVWKRDGNSFAGTTVELDPARDPKALDVIPDGGKLKGKRVLGIYKLDGDTLTICMAAPDQDRPTVFEAGKGSQRTLMTFKREQPRP